ncbi:PEP/pyruvate-binding domain-containing protein [Breoghania sp.]|uniref:PEP/pyruvate-binding domain-containing protein n=1 Tax=Breoghania sp. TaxID=2065378 RepID=UPI0029C949BF|nr:PEP/pyruvate-binding domain-containing protein [Breoghania sp.]
MTGLQNAPAKEFCSHFKMFHEMMPFKVQEILLVSSPYDAFIMEEDGSLASRIINEYSGLNLSHPPRVTRTASARDALAVLKNKTIDLVITTPHLDEMDAFSFSLQIKATAPDLPVILLSHSPRGVFPLPENRDCSGIDKVFIWSGNSDLLLALVKNTEDHLNVSNDTINAKVRVLVLVEDSPVYYSSFLPLIYREIVKQTQAVLGVGLNEEHRLLRMRSRPKILLANTYEDALALCTRYQEYLLGVISDTRIPKNGRLTEDAGFLLLSKLKKEIPDLPMLLLSAESVNRARAARIPAIFLDKNAPDLLSELHDFFMDHLGFGDFVFRMPDGKEIARASDLRSLQALLPEIPEASLWHHARRNHFSNWIMGRSEVALASRFREVHARDFQDTESLRGYIIAGIKEMRKWQQKGVVAQFSKKSFDARIMDFVKIGHGSLGGKARGLAFLSALLQQDMSIYEKFPGIDIRIPQTLVISTDGFEAFIAHNNLRRLSGQTLPDDVIKHLFLKADLPDWLVEDLKAFLDQVDYPLSVRSSSLLEDAQFQPYAGLYETYMIPNNHRSLNRRLDHLVTAVKLVYASTFYEGPRAFSKATGNAPQEEAMAVIVQELAGRSYGDFFYPAISGVAQSHNFYPIPPMKPDEGITHIALGLGKTVVEGEKTVRFSPRYPSILPQFSVIDDILKNSQHRFYALKIKNYPEKLDFATNGNLERRRLEDALQEAPVLSLSSTYVPDEHRIRDTSTVQGVKVLTFAQVLKYGSFPLPEVLAEILELGRRGMGCPVEIEFSVTLGSKRSRQEAFHLLQIRPMVAGEGRFEVRINPEDICNAFCTSSQALGNGKNEEIADIVYVKPDAFKKEATTEMVDEIGLVNTSLVNDNRRYLLAGPGRWGSSDRWLGIPVQWHHISGAGAIIESRDANLKADPSQGSHFFQNITSQGVFYVTVNEGSDDYLEWSWLDHLPVVQEMSYIRHVRLEHPIVIKIDGRSSQCVMVKPA